MIKFGSNLLKTIDKGIVVCFGLRGIIAAISLGIHIELLGKKAQFLCIQCPHLGKYLRIHP